MLGPGVDETRLVELVGEAARGSVRQGDVVGHLGAGRFALLFPRAGTFEARAAHRRVREAVSRLALDGEEIACGWVRDRYGVPWQIVPTRLRELLNDPDREKADRVMQAMLQMKKIEVAGLERAADERP